ncbi:MAG: glycosyltransferase [Bacteroidota bacterium]|nr:glycosyltransferase [Bacteroidota bacterium]
MQKKTILHFIYSLGRGGAETMLVRTLRELKEYNNIVITIKDENDFGNELKCDKHICLHLEKMAVFPLAIFKIKKIIRENNVDIVHSHLFWPTIISRIAVPKSIPLITTIHAFIATSIEYKTWYIRILDRVTYKLRKSVIVAVAKGAQNEYFSFLHLKPYKTYVLYTFVDMERYTQKNIAVETEAFKLITVGALRIQKNQSYLIKAMSLIKDADVELHIYGGGPLESHLQQLINQTGAKVFLKGVVKNIEEVLPLYNGFVMSSTFEGFSLAVLEAMAVKTPLLLSDIDSFKEQCDDTALYFRLDDEQDFVKKINILRNNKTERDRLGEEAFRRVNENFTLSYHMVGLRQIYSEAHL